MKYFIILILIKLLCYNAEAQSKRYVYYFDSEMNPSSKAKAVVVGQGIKMESGVRVGFSVIEPRRLFKTTEYQDSSLAVMNGKDIEYFDNGGKKYESMYKMDRLNGTTLKWDSTGLLTDSIVYNEDKMQHKTRYEYDFSGKPSRRILY